MKIVLASKSGVKKILDDHNIDNEVIVSNVDEDSKKISQMKGQTIISKNLAEINQLKSAKNDQLVLGLIVSYL